MRFRRYLLGIITGTIVLAALGYYFYFDYAIVYLFAKTNKLEMSYRSYEKISFGELVFKDFSMLSRGAGFGINAESADIKLKINGLSFNPDMVDITLKGIRLIREGLKNKEEYDTLTGLVDMPFSDSRSYTEIQAKMIPRETELTIKDLSATSDNIKLSCSGTFTNANTINADITIYFSDKLTSKIPPELSKVILANCTDGWLSLSVHLEGDLKAPSIQVSNKLFRLNIKMVSKS